MKLGVISDIHCNHEALGMALDRLSGSVDEVFIAGDAVYEYRFSNEVVGTIREGGFPYVLGNHEMVLLGAAGERARSTPGICQQDLQFVARRPTRIDCRIGGRSVTMVHGSPWAPYDRYLGPDDPDWLRCQEMEAEILITGHTHIPMVKTVGDTVIVNPGSLGESREPQARSMVSYAIVDLDSAAVEIVRMHNPML